ncbi:hypothetical protein SDJN03_24490, partial [Cucurbita argyrosperma subsp. sororia]
MEMKMKNTGLVVVMMVTMIMMATLADSAVAEGGGFRSKILLKSEGSSECPTYLSCETHEDCPFNCACYTAGHCGDFVG